MLPSRRVTAVLIWGIIGCAVQQSNAAMAGYQISGTVTYVTRGPSCPVDPLIQVGTPVQGFLLYDLDAPDLNPSSQQGSYRPDGRFVLQIGALTVEPAANGWGIGITNDVGTSDAIRAGGVELFVDGYRIGQFYLAVDGPTWLLPSDSLPTVPLDTSDMTLSSFVILGGSSSSDSIKINSRIEEWVAIPEPSTKVGIVALAAVGLRRHRRR